MRSSSSTLPFLLITSCLAAFTAGPSVAEEPTAVVMALEGDVAVVGEGGSLLAARFGADLRSGDEVRTGQDSWADVLFASGQSIHLGSDSQITIQSGKRNHDSAVGSPDTYTSAKRFLQLRESRGTSAMTGLRSGAKRPDLNPVTPRGGVILGPRPVFEWRAPSDAGELTLVLYGPDGEQWRTQVDAEIHVEYPEDAPELIAGVEYSWTLESTDPLRFPPLRTPATYFEIADNETASRVSQAIADLDQTALSPQTRRIVRASIFHEYQLLSLAIEEILQAQTETRDDLRAILANLYVEAGRTDDALTVYDGLLEPRQ
jgi:hypothetical protein